MINTKLLEPKNVAIIGVFSIVFTYLTKKLYEKYGKGE